MTSDEQGEARVETMKDCASNVHVREVLTCKNLEEVLKETTGKTLLLQVGSPTCVRCPEFHKAIAKLSETWQFVSKGVPGP